MKYCSIENILGHITLKVHCGDGSMGRTHPQCVHFSSFIWKLYSEFTNTYLNIKVHKQTAGHYSEIANKKSNNENYGFITQNIGIIKPLILVVLKEI